MLEAAAKSLTSYQTPPMLIGVTVLTSMNSEQLSSTGVQSLPQQQVRSLAKLCANSGLAGVVCSAQEASVLREEQGSDFVLVTPGIRPEGSASGDQQRIMTPVKAKLAGSSYLVIGRPITEASDPLSVIRSIQQSLETD